MAIKGSACVKRDNKNADESREPAILLHQWQQDVTTTVLPRKRKLKIERPEMHFKMHKVDLMIPPLTLAPKDDQNSG